MPDNPLISDSPSSVQEPAPKVRSLRELIELVTGRGSEPAQGGGDAGIAEPLPFPFLALVGQTEMKLALILNLINPNIGGILLIGPRGTGKSTAVRSLLDLMPEIVRSSCFYGCLPEDIEQGGIDAVCPDCARKYGEGRPLTVQGRVQLIELPLNSSLEDVIGGLDDRALVHNRMRLKRGLLSQADKNILYVDEVNLLDDDIVDAILDAAAQGAYTVRRGPVSASYRAQFTLIGSMNPEEGRLRPQIMDRFGLRVMVRGLSETSERLEAYRRVKSYLWNPRGTIAQFSAETELVQQEIEQARARINQVVLPEEIAAVGIHLIQSLQIDSLRADITLFETARAYTAADGRFQVEIEDLKRVSPIALRLRRSQFIEEYLSVQKAEEEEILARVDAVLHDR
jgi:magnesium chelatase subunit I